jgi:hypothetical protein
MISDIGSNFVGTHSSAAPGMFAGLVAAGSGRSVWG